MPFFSVGYGRTPRLEVTLLTPPTAHSEWLAANVRVEVDGFNGETQISLTVSDMIKFKEQLKPLYESLQGKAEFQTIEGQLYILLEADGLGHIQATGYLLKNSISETKLCFEMEFDQTLLRHTISEIDEALFQLSG